MRGVRRKRRTGNLRSFTAFAFKLGTYLNKQQGGGDIQSQTIYIGFRHYRSMRLFCCELPSIAYQ